MAVTPKSSMSALSAAFETKSRLEKCWKTDINWELYPKIISEVSILANVALVCMNSCYSLIGLQTDRQIDEYATDCCFKWHYIRSGILHEPCNSEYPRNGLG